MDNMDALNVKRDKKASAIDSEVTKIGNLKVQIEMYEKSIVRLEESSGVKRDELKEMDALIEQAKDLVEKRNSLLVYTEGLREKFDAFEWSADMPWEQKIESSDYKMKVDERHALNAELDAIEKKVNKIYYRR